jgi:type IV pilus assembly protein PilQ
MQISALESDGNGKVISTPRVTTLNGKSALISQGTSIPYQSQDDNGTKTEFVDAELKLEVTPVINPDGTILLEILATNDSPSFTPLAGAPSIDTKKAETTVLVRDGETTVIGGIFVESIIDSEDGIPWLMDIPGLGNLFKSTNKQRIKNELLIFITPRIVHDN